MKWRSKLHNLTKMWFGAGSRRKPLHKRRLLSAVLHVEQLETRVVPAGTLGLSGNVLTLTDTGSPTITVALASNNYTITDSTGLSGTISGWNISGTTATETDGNAGIITQLTFSTTGATFGNSTTGIAGGAANVAITDAGTATIGASSTLTTSGAVSITGVSVVDTGTIGSATNGAIAISGPFSGAGALTLGTAGATITQTTASTFSGVISGSQGLAKAGAGVLTLSGTNTYTGTTTITAGSLSVGADANLGTAPSTATPGDIILSGGTLLANNTFTLNANRGIALGAATGTGSGEIDVLAAKTLTYGGIIANNGTGDTLTVGSSGNTGTLILNGANTFANGANGVTENYGEIEIGNATALGTGKLTVATTANFNAGAASSVSPPTEFFLYINNSGNMTVANAIALPAPTAADTFTIESTGATGGNGMVTLSGVISGGGADLGLILFNTTAGDVTSTYEFTGANTFVATEDVVLYRSSFIVTSAASIGASTNPFFLRATVNSTLGDLRFAASGITFPNPIVIISADGNDDVSASGFNDTLSGVISNTGNFTEVGTGSLTLTATSTYTGSTVISGGTLYLNGTLSATTGVTVAAGATLAGTNGTINAAATVTVTGTLSPGNGTAPGVLNLGSLAFATGGVYNVTLNGVTALAPTTYDEVVASGTVNLTNGAIGLASQNLANINAGIPMLVIKNNGTAAVTGTFTGQPEGSTVTLGGINYTVSYIGGDGNDVTLTRQANASQSSPNNPIIVDQSYSSSTPGWGTYAFSTIGSAIAAVAAGAAGTSGTVGYGPDTVIYVDSGTYNEDVVISGQLTLEINSTNVAATNGPVTIGSLADNVTNAALALTSGATLVTGDTTSTSFGSVIGGLGILELTGTGTFTLNNTSNSYTGGTVVNGGILTLGATGALPSNNTFASDTSVTVNTPGIFNLNAKTESIVGLSGTGTVEDAITGSTSVTLTVGTFNVTSNFGGILENTSGTGTGKLSLTKTGTGTFTLSGTASTYTGVTTVNAGTLAVMGLAIGGQPSSVGASTNAAANLVIQGGAVFQYAPVGSTATTDRSFTNGSASGGGTFAVTDPGSTVTDTSGLVTNSDTASGFANATDFTKSGAGTLNFSANNALYTNFTTGNITVSGGTLGIATIELTRTSSVEHLITLNSGTFLNSSGTIETIATGSAQFSAISGAGTINLVNPSSSASNPDIYFNYGSVVNSSADDGDNISAAINLGSSPRYVEGLTEHNSVPSYGQYADSAFTGVISGSAGASLILLGEDNYNPSSGSNWMEMPFYLDNGANTFTGPIQIQRGSLYISATGSMPGNNLTLDPTGVGSVTITSGGSGYTSAPTVTFSGGGGSGAAGTAVLTSGAVTSVTLTSAGTGYTAAPTVSFSGGGGSGAAGTSVMFNALFFLDGVSANIGNLSSSGAGTSEIANSPGYSSVAAATLTVTQTTNGTYAGSIIQTQTDGVTTASGTSGAISLVLSNTSTATLTLSGTSSITGNVTVNGGTLNVSGSLTASGTSNDTIASGATLVSGTAMTLGGAIVDNGTLVPGGSDVGGLITASGLSFGSGGVLSIDLLGNSPGTATGYDQIISNGPVNLTGAVLNLANVSITNLNPGIPLTLIQGNSPVTGIFSSVTGANVSYTSLTEGSTITVGTGSSAVNFIISYIGGAGGDNVTLTRQPGSTYTVDTTFNSSTPGFGVTTFNTVGSCLAVAPAFSNIVVDAGAYNEDVVVNQPETIQIQAGSTSFNSLADTVSNNVLDLLGNLTVGADNMTTTFSSTILGPGSLTQIGTGVFTLGGANSFSGGTFVNAGAIYSGSTTAAGAGSLTVASGADFQLDGFSQTFTQVSNSGTIENNSTTPATLSFANAGGTTFTGVFNNGAASGSLSLAITGSSTLTLDGASTYSGSTTDNGVALQAGSTTALGVNSTTSLNNGASLALEGFNLSVGSIAGTGNVSNGGTTNAVLTVGGDGTSTTSGGLFSDGGAGTLALLKTGAGTFQMNGVTSATPNTYSGGTTVSQGTLETGNPGGWGTGAITLADANSGSSPIGLLLTNSVNVSNPITVTNNGTGTVTIGTAVYTNGTNVTYFNSNITLGRSVTFQGGNTLITGFTGFITGPGGITTTNVNGSSRVSLVRSSTAYPVNNYTGNLTIGAGSLAEVEIASADANTAIPDGDTVNFANATSTLAFAPLGADTETVNALVSQAAGAGVVEPFYGANTNTFSLIIGAGDGSGAYSGTIISNAASGIDLLSLTKTGTGTQTLSGVNTYTAGTTVQGGTLLVNNASGSGLGTGAVTVGPQGVLGGSGSFTGAVTVSGALSPSDFGGTAPTTLKTGNLSFGAGGLLAVDLTSTANDLVSVTGTANLNNANLVIDAGSGLIPGAQFTILTTTGALSGAFANGTTFVAANNPQDVFTVSVSGTTVKLTLISVSGAGPILDFTAGAVNLYALAGANDGVTVSNAGGVYTVADSAGAIALTSNATAAGWVVNGNGSVTGPSAGTTVNAIYLNLGDGADQIASLSAGAPVIVDGTGTLTIAGATTTTGNLTIEGFTNLAVQNTVSAANVTVSLPGTITATAAGQLAGTTLNLSAAGGIGAAANNVVTNGTTITTSSVGAVYLTETAGGTITSSTSGLNDIVLTNLTGSLTVTAATTDGNIIVNNQGSGLTLTGTAGGFGNITATNAAGTLTIAGATMTTGFGNITLSSGGAVAVNANVGSSTETGTITINANTAGTGSAGYTQATTAILQTANTSATGIVINVNTATGGAGNAVLGGAIVGTAAAGTYTVNANGGSITDNSAFTFPNHTAATSPTWAITAFSTVFNTSGAGSIGASQLQPLILNTTSDSSTGSFVAGSGGIYVLSFGNGITFVSGDGYFQVVTQAIAAGAGNIWIQTTNESNHGLTINGPVWTQSGYIQLDSNNNVLMGSAAVIGGTMNTQQFSGNVLIHVNMALSGSHYLQMSPGSSITTTSTAANAVVVHAYPTTTGGGIQAGNITVGNGGGIQLYAAFDASQEPVQNPPVTDVTNPTNTTRSGSITQMSGTMLDAGANGTITLEAASLGVATEGNIGLTGAIQTNAGTVNAVSTNQASATGGNIYITNQGPATFTASTTAVSGTSAGGISLTTNTGLLTVAGVNVTSGGAITLTGSGGVTIASGATLGNSATTGGISINAGGSAATLNATLTLYPNESLYVNATPFALVIGATGVLAGSGAMSNNYPVTTQTGGVISPGTTAAPTGILTTGNVDMSAGGAFFADLTSTGSNDLNVGGTINLTGATLTGTLATGFNAAAGTVFTIITAASPITGAFAGLPEGSVAVIGGAPFTISYLGNSGQDVTLTLLSQAPVITSATSTHFTVDAASSFTVAATAYPLPTYTETGALPTGVTLTSAGVLSGTPTQTGVFPIVITASNGISPNATQSFNLTVDPGLFATSFFDSAVYEFDANTGALAATLVAPYTSALLSGPAGLTMGPDGNLYISSQFSNAILEYNLGANTLSPFIPSSVLAPIATTIGAPSFAPAGLTFGPDGNLYVSLNGGQSSTTGAVVCFNITNTGGVLSYAGTDTLVDSTGLVQPTGLTFGTTGDATSLYVSNSGADTVVKIAAATGSSPTASTFITGGSSTGNLNYPAGLAWGPGGKLYVVDLGATSFQGNVLEFNANGSFNSVYAQPNGGGQGGLLFQFPSDAVFGSQGQLYTANLGPANPPNLGGSINLYDSTGVFNSALVTSAQFPNTGAGTSGISPSQIVLDPNTTTTTVTSTPASPIAQGASISFTASITGYPDGGTVTFYAGPGLTNPIGSPVNVVDGLATSAATTALPVGTDTVTAVYSGGTRFAGSQGAATVVVNSSTTTTVTASPGTTVTYGTAVTFTATVTATAGSRAPSQGSVNFSIDGGSPIAGTVLSSSGTSSTWTFTTTTTQLLVAGSPYTISATYIAGTGFTGSSSSGAGNVSETVTPFALTVTGVTASNKVYDTTTTATLNTGSATLVGVFTGDTVTLSTSGATGTFASKDVGTGITVNVSGLTISGAQASDYTLTQPTPTANITPYALTVTGITANNKVYDSTTVGTVNASSATLMGVFTGDTVTLNTSGATGSFTSKDVGTGITVTVLGLTLGGAQANDYTVTQPTTTANITPATLTVSGITASDKVYDSTTTATLNTTSAALVGVFSGDTVTLRTTSATGTFASKDVGTGITVTASGLTLGGAQAGDYTLTQPTTTANITPATLIVSGVTASNKVYNATTTATLNTASAALVGVFSGDTVTLSTSSATGTFASKDVANNITVTASGLTIGGAQAGDYTLTQPTTTANITPFALTVSGVTASNKVYNATTTATLNTSSASLLGVFSGDTVTLSTSAATGTFASKDVGTGITVTVSGLTLSGAQAGDYTLTQPTTTANITPFALTVSGVTASNKVYNATTTATLNTASAALVGVFSGDTVTLSTSSATGTFASKDVGTGISVNVSGLTIGGAQAGDYTLTQPTTTANITPATLTVSGVTASNKVYDSTTTATVNTASAALVGVFSGDTVTLSLSLGGATGTFASKNVGTGITVTASGLTLGGAQAGDYTLTQPTTTANITPATLIVSGVTASNKVYNATTTATLNTASAALVGVFSGDTVTLSTSSATGTFASKDVANNITVTASGLTISGAQAADYTLTQPTTTANITPFALTVSGVTASNKVYNATTTATLNTASAALVGVFSGDTVTLSTSSATGTFASKDVANNITVTASGLTIGGAQAGDYTLTQPTTTANITPATLTVSGVTASNKVYDSTTTATVNTASAALVGVFSGDTVTLSLSLGGATGTFASKDVGTGITVTASGLTLGGAQAGDYTLTQPTTTANITPATLIVSGVTASNKVYNATTTATLNTASAALVGVFSGDTVTLSTSSATGTFASKDVANNITVTASGLTLGGAQASDYTLTQPTTTANITPATLTVSGVTASNKVYNGTTTATLNTGSAALVGVFTGDTVSLSTSGATGAFPSRNVGTGLTVTVAGLTLGGAQAADYTLTQPTTTANITAMALTVTATTNTKTYDGTTSASAIPTITSGTVASGDTAMFTEAYASPTVGTGLTLIPSGSVSDGNSGNNYTYTFVNNTTGVINSAVDTVTHFAVMASPSSVTAGGGIALFVVAEDANNNEVTSYSGTATITSNDPLGPSEGTITLSNGVGFGPAVLETATTTGWTISATAGTLSGQSSAITVTPGAVTHFVVTAPSSTLTLNSTNFTVTAEDQYNNLATGYSGTVAFTSSDGAVSAGSGLPLNSTLVNGTGTFTATLKTPGNQTITATDASNSALVGNSNAIATRGLYVSSFATTPSGFTATFSKVVNLTTFDYYRFSASQSQAPDVAMATVGSATTNVDGTLLVSSTATQTTITFVATQGALTNAAKYFVTLTSGAGGIVDTSGEQLAGDANGFLPGTNYVVTNLAPASSTTPTLSIPGFARGPNSSATVQITTNSVTAAGIPITLTHAPANTTEVQFTLDFNPALLNVTGPTSGTFTLLNPGTANSTGVANFEYNGSALSTTSAVLGDIVADVPNSAANEMLQKTLLDLPVADIFFNGSATPASPVQNADGVQVVDYLGETTTNFGVINSVDASNAQAVVTANTTPTTANQPAGLQAFPLADPYLIAGSTGSTTFKVVAADVTGLNRFAVSLSHPFIPTPPTGLTYSSPGPDPTVSLPTNLQVTAGGIVTVPVNIDDPRPAGSDGMTQAELALTYDPSVFSLTSADVQLGTVPASGTGWTLTSQINPLTGQIAIFLESQTPISSAAGGSLVSIDFHVNPGATLGATPVNLAASVNPTGNAVVWTRLFDSQQEFTLSPAPSNTVSAAGLDAMVVVTPVDAGTAEGGAGSNLGTPAEIGSVISAAPTLLPELASAVAPVVVPEEDKQGIAAPVDDAVAEGQTVHASGSAARTASFVPEPVTFSVNAGTTPASAADGLVFPFSSTAAPGVLVPETSAAQQLADQCFLDLPRGTTAAGVRQDAFLQDLASQVTQARSVEDNADTDLPWLQGMGELPALGARYGRREAAANYVTPQEIEDLLSEGGDHGRIALDGLDVVWGGVSSSAVGDEVFVQTGKDAGSQTDSIADWKQSSGEEAPPGR